MHPCRCRVRRFSSYGSYVTFLPRQILEMLNISIHAHLPVLLYFLGRTNSGFFEFLQKYYKVLFTSYLPNHKCSEPSNSLAALPGIDRYALIPFLAYFALYVKCTPKLIYLCIFVLFIFPPFFIF